MNRRQFFASPLAALGINLDDVDPKIRAAFILAETKRLVSDDDYRRRMAAEFQRAAGPTLSRQLVRAFVSDALAGRPRVRRFVLNRI